MFKSNSNAAMENVGVVVNLKGTALKTPRDL
jgi:chaperone required for assembly of F1-ATPase